MYLQAKLLLLIHTVWTFAKIISAIFRHDNRMHSSIVFKNCMMFTLFLTPPSYEEVYCFICSCRRVAVSRYRMLCLVPATMMLQQFLCFVHFIIDKLHYMLIKILLFLASLFVFFFSILNKEKSTRIII